ncbi:MAG: class I SAM-dependent methyltransferase [Burkholderiales bacterium]
MTALSKWKDSLRLFFADRATQIKGMPTIEDLCYISGREPRLWTQPEMYADLIKNLLFQMDATSQSSILEVGCAAGFIAKGIAPLVKHYVGVDLARPALRAARLLQLPNADFRYAEGGKLPFADDSFDAVFCYDVFTNFPQFADGAPIINEIVRVVRPGGKAVIGSIPNGARQLAYEERVKQFTAELDARFGPRKEAYGESTGLTRRIRHWWTKTDPLVSCYYFRAEDFTSLGSKLGVHVAITDIHPLNPYVTYRFNAVYTKTPNP